MMNFSNSEKLTVQQFCCMPVGEDDGVIVTCSNFATGELIAQDEYGTMIPMPVCEECVEKIRLHREVATFDPTDGM